MGIYVLGPIGPARWDMILAGVRVLAALGINLCFCITNEPGLPEAIKAIMPKALIFYRAAFTAHDQNPEERGWPSGAAWVKELWDRSYWSVQGVDVWVFTNEWWDNKRDSAFIARFTKFWKEVIDECLRRKIVCTVGDLPVGTPGWPTLPAEAHQLPALQELLSYIEAAGMWWNQHLYDLLDPVSGNLMPKELTWTRYRLVRSGHPKLKIVGGELGDINRGGGMFTSKTLDNMKWMYSLIRGEIIGGWWLLCLPEAQKNPEGDWSGDDWTLIFWQYVDFVKEKK